MERLTFFPRVVSESLWNSPFQISQLTVINSVTILKIHNHSPYHVGLRAMLLLLASRNTTCGFAVCFLTFKAGGCEWFSTDGVGGGLPVGPACLP